MFNLASIEHRLTEKANEPDSTPALLRELGADLLDGRLREFPIIAYAPGNRVTMRFETTEGTIWPEVPAKWMQLER